MSGPLARNRRLRLQGLSGILLCAAGLAAGALPPPAQAQVREGTRAFDIPSGPLGRALELYVGQSEVELIFRSDEIGAARTAGVRGRHADEEALRRLLRGTGFSFRRDISGAIAIVRTGGLTSRRGPPAQRPPSTVAPRRTTPAPPTIAPTIESIIVTARRTEESWLDVPMAITAIGADALASNNATNLAKVAEVAPQMLIGEFGSGTGALLTIRGIGSDAIDFGLDQSVLVVVDGVPISSGSVIRQSLFDIEQIEVMPGPQALYFGKNALAGVISVESADPADTPSGYLKAGYEFEADERYLEGAVSGPLTDHVRARFAIRASAMQGWISNRARPLQSPFDPSVLLPGNLNRTSPDASQHSARISLDWSPSPDLDIGMKFTVDRQKLGGNGNLAFHEAWCDGSAPQTEDVLQPGADCAKDQRVAVSAYPAAFAETFPYARDGTPYRINEILLGSLTLRKRFDGLTVTATTGLYDQEHVGSNCADGVFCQLFSTIRTRYRLVSQELRTDADLLDGLKMMFGLYVEHSRRSWFTAIDFFHAFNPQANDYVSFATQADGGYSGYSIFGQIKWNVAADMEFALGGRYSRDRKSAVLVNRVVNPLAINPTRFDLYPQGQDVKVRIGDTNFSPEATLSWHPLPLQTVYAAYRTGYKAGGVSNPSLFYAYNTPETLTFGREKAAGIEVGYKADLLSNRLRLGLSLYRYIIDDLQVVSENANLFAFQIGNAAKARTQGIEMAAVWRPTRDIELEGSIGYNDGRYLRYSGVQCYPGQNRAGGCDGTTQDISGRRLVRAPAVTLHLGLDRGFALPGDWRVDLGLDGFYTSSYQGSTTANPGGIQPSFWRLNAKLQLASPDGAYRLSLIGRNLTDAYYLAAANNLPLGGETDFFGPFNRPRELLLQAEFRF